MVLISVFPDKNGVIKFKLEHEIRDPIHAFIKVSSEERKIIDYPSFQRLRYIHQLALSYLVYPGATHKRFEHSLGVMELASRVYDIVTERQNVHSTVEEIIPEIVGDQKDYWRKVIRAAALCHDLGHIPFSHAAETELLSEGFKHENFTLKLISELENIWSEITPPLRTEDIKKVAVGPKIYKGKLSNWESILSEIITGDAFGVDRMDYLLRDSYHIGVAYGKFDHYRLIDTLRILQKEYEESEEPALGVEMGGIYNAEALLLARYFMFSQVYMHPVRRIFDIHLKNFMKSYYGELDEDLEVHQGMTDYKVLADMNDVISNNSSAAAEAKRILGRKHYKKLYQFKPSDKKYDPEPGKVIYQAALEKFGPENVEYDKYSQSESSYDFPVEYQDGSILSSVNVSDAIERIPLVSIEFVFINAELQDEGDKWLEENKKTILSG